MAEVSGCDFLVLTDHGDASDEKAPEDAIAGTASYWRFLESREAIPDLLQFYGVEWNFTPEHTASVILEPGDAEREIIASFLDRFDAHRIYAPDPLEACAWLYEQTSGSAVIIINEPSTISSHELRNPVEVIGPLVEGCPLIVAIEGAQGHTIPKRFRIKKDSQPITGRSEP